MHSFFLSPCSLALNKCKRSIRAHFPLRVALNTCTLSSLSLPGNNFLLQDLHLTYLLAIFVFESKWLFFCVSESTKNEILQDGDCVFDSACPSEDVSLPCSYQDLLEGRFHRQIDVHTAVLILKATWWCIRL